MPRRRLACTSITGIPSRSDNWLTAIFMPRCAATSIMFSAITVGNPSSSTWLHQIEIPARDCFWHRRCTARRRRGGGWPSAEQHVDGHHFVRRAWGEAVRCRRRSMSAKQLPSAISACLADFLLDGHARVVAHPLPHAGQRREERRFARVRVADQGEQVRGFSVAAAMLMERNRCRGLRTAAAGNLEFVPLRREPLPTVLRKAQSIPRTQFKLDWIS